MRLSGKRTTVAILRTMLGLSVEEFGELIGKSVPTIRALESGKLKLSEKTALRIAEETGVSIKWLLDGDTESEPYREEGTTRRPFDKSVYEEKQASQTVTGIDHEKRIDAVKGFLVTVAVFELVPTFVSASKKGKAKLMVYHLQKFLDTMKQKFGYDERVIQSLLRGRDEIIIKIPLKTDARQNKKESPPRSQKT
jgi:transcriptional regulator with XRE-family HTH domain